MGYNIDFTRFKSSGLAGLDCGSYLKVPRRDQNIEITEVYDGDLEVGQCVSMIRVPKGARIVAGELYWGGNGGTTTLAVGDPFACARLIGPVSTARDRGVTLPLATGPECTKWMTWGTCGKLERVGRVGDGCGLFYQYTCETDIVVTNLYHSGLANLGGWPGAALPADNVGAKWTGGRIVLTITYKDQS